MKAKIFSGTVPASYFTPGLLKYPEDVTALVFGERHPICSRGMCGQFRHPEATPATQDDTPFDDALQFPNISRPRVVKQFLHLRLGNIVNRFTYFSGVRLEEE